MNILVLRDQKLYEKKILNFFTWLWQGAKESLKAAGAGEGGRHTDCRPPPSWCLGRWPDTRPACVPATAPEGVPRQSWWHRAARPPLLGLLRHHLHRQHLLPLLLANLLSKKVNIMNDNKLKLIKT